jgi:hypothetical protein
VPVAPVWKYAGQTRHSSRLADLQYFEYAINANQEGWTNLGLSGKLAESIPTDFAFA